MKTTVTTAATAHTQQTETAGNNFIMLRPPPSSTLRGTHFPYTPLFR
eukprot:COSAG05_NODE_17045_length_333_cov_0.658120_2_plen_46_part_01